MSHVESTGLAASLCCIHMYTSVSHIFYTSHIMYESCHILQESCHILQESCHISQWVMSHMDLTGLAASQCCTAICTLLDALRETDSPQLFTSIETALVSYSPSPTVAACCSVLQCVAVFAVCGCSVRDQLCPNLYEHRNRSEVLFLFSHCCSVLQCVAVCGCSTWDRLLPTFYKHRNRIGVIFPFSHYCGVLQRVAVFAVCGCSARDQLSPTLYEHKTRIGEHSVSYSPFSICSMLQCAVVCCSVLQCVTACCSLLHCVAVYCSVLQCIVECCGVLQTTVLVYYPCIPWFAPQKRFSLSLCGSDSPSLCAH